METPVIIGIVVVVALLAILALGLVLARRRRVSLGSAVDKAVESSPAAGGYQTRAGFDFGSGGDTATLDRPADPVDEPATAAPVAVPVDAADLSTGLGDLVAASFHRMHSVRGRSWRMDPDMGGGAVFDLLIHDYDLMLWYMGRPSCVVARGIRNALGSYDYAAATFVLPGGALAVVEGGFVLRPPAGLTATLRLVGTRGHLEADAQAETPIRVFEEGKSPESILPGADSARVAGVASELLEFCEAVAGRPPDRLRLEDACQDVAIAATVVRAADTGQELAV